MKISPQFVSVVAGLAAAGELFAQTTPTPPLAPANAPDAAQTGRTVYEQHCAACHGLNGGGDGPAAVWLYPKPRRFYSGLFKIRSTPSGFLPTDEDLLQTITRGMPGSSMPSFTYLSEQERRDVVQYVKYLTAYVDESGKRVNFFADATAKGSVGVPIEVPPEPPVTVQSLAEGQGLYSKMNCFTCHGLNGEGMGTSKLKIPAAKLGTARNMNTVAKLAEMAAQL